MLLTLTALALPGARPPARRAIPVSAPTTVAALLETAARRFGVTPGTPLELVLYDSGTQQMGRVLGMDEDVMQIEFPSAGKCAAVRVQGSGATLADAQTPSLSPLSTPRESTPDINATKTPTQNPSPAVKPRAEGALSRTRITPRQNIDKDTQQTTPKPVPSTESKPVTGSEDVNKEAASTPQRTERRVSALSKLPKELEDVISESIPLKEYPKIPTIPVSNDKSLNKNISTKVCERVKNETLLEEEEQKKRRKYEEEEEENEEDDG